MKALKELNVLSPLKELSFSKEEIRNISKDLSLKTWDKPSYPCLVTRIPYGEKITSEKLNVIHKCEKYLNDQGFKILG